MEMKAFNPHTVIFVDGKDSPEKRRLLKTLNRVIRLFPQMKSQLYKNGELLRETEYTPAQLVDYLNDMSRNNLRDTFEFLENYKVTSDMLDNRNYIKQVRPKLKSFVIVNRETYPGLYSRAKYVTNADLTAGLTREEGRRFENACEMCRPMFINIMPVVSIYSSQEDQLIESRASFIAEAAMRIHLGRTSDKRAISTNGEFMLLYRKNNDESLDFVGGHFARYNIN